MSLKLVIFDMDGLMYDTEPIGMRCLQETAKKYGYNLDNQFVLNSIGMNVNDHRCLLLDKLGSDYPYDKISQESRKRRLDYLLENGITIKPGLKELIAYLKDKKIKIAIASSSKRETIDLYNQMAGLSDVFDFIMSGDLVEHSKPDPEIYLKVLKHFQVTSDEVIILEDSKNGILSGYNAKCRVICVPDLVKHGPEMNKFIYRTVSSLFDVIEVVEKLMDCNQ